MKSQLTEIGELDGWRITAVTDAMGPQLIRKKDDKVYLSVPLKNHRAIVAMGKRVLKEGFDVIKWTDQVQNFGELAYALMVGSLINGEPFA